MTRLVAEVFFGQPRSSAAEHAHENSTVMTAPLVLLALGAIAFGFIGTPAWPWLQSTLTGQPVEPHSLFAGGGLMMLSIVLVALGLGAGWALYGRRLRDSDTALDPLASAAPGAFRFLSARMKFDELYATTFGRLNNVFATFADFIDRRVWNGLVNLLAAFGEFAGKFSHGADEAGLNAGFNSTSETLRAAGRAYSRAQTGDAHGYLRTVAIGFALLALFLILGGAS
jgi:NADH-quinone oxidoreductase subunit L